MKRSLLGFILLAAAGFAAGQITPSGGGYLFRLKVTKGEHLNFGVPVTIGGLANISGKEYHLRLSLALYVKSLDKYQNATIHGVIKKAGLGPDQTGDIVVSKRGQILNSTKTMMGFCLLYPSGVIKVGVPFRTAVPIAVAGPDLKASVSTENGIFTLVGFSGSGANRVAKLTFRVSGNRAPGGTILVGTRDGVIQRYSTDFYVTLPGAPPTDPPAHVKATVIRE